MTKAGLFTTAALAVAFFVANDTVAQSSDNQRAFKAVTVSNPTIQRQASEYTDENAVLGIISKRGPENESAFNDFMKRLSAKLIEKNIPHKFFVEVTDTPGVVFAYFVDGKQHGPFNLKEFVAMLPEAERDFREIHPTVTASIKSIEANDQKVAGIN